MPIQLSEEGCGKLLNVHVSGKLTGADYEHSVPEFERLVGEHGKLSVLFDMTNFHGWDVGALREDTKFAVKHFADIARIALVGDTMWQRGMATFCKPFTKASVRRFDRTQSTDARTWLAELNETFEQARSKGLGIDDLTRVAQAAAAGRVATLLIEADRQIVGRLDGATGRVEVADLCHPQLDDQLHALGELVEKTGGQVLVTPAKQMPGRTGLAASYRY